jgi:glycogen synthase
VQSAAQALQAAIDLYTSNQPEYAAMIYGGYRMLDKFSWERAVREYRRLYDQVCDQCH